MQTIRAQETGAVVAFCIPLLAPVEAFDEAYDHASKTFWSVSCDKCGRWARIKSDLAWGRTTHPPVPPVADKGYPHHPDELKKAQEAIKKRGAVPV